MFELLATVDPFAALLGSLWLFAAGMFPVGFMLGSSCSACCGGEEPCSACTQGSLPCLFGTHLLLIRTKDCEHSVKDFWVFVFSSSTV